ncbi:probable malonyl-CoA-acyl carrier protein transacylase, mitochondrial [Neodiprion pinetum]|uniref:probable malonyl-CoA-acyl carrier protein transacylase, mitochondrial n=1 Tax=Neodiprion pinetum TaxID=441929 RepID=UPI001EDCB865|nr:probable malonyl-CoA-acyl carrier protein transacylase, mitochondrial [Neodiprion pinetum]
MLPRTCYRAISSRSNLFRLSRCMLSRSLSDKPPCENGDHETTDKKSSEISQLLEGATIYDPAENSGWATSAYPENCIPNVQGQHAERPNINPTETSIILFPGQGNIKVGDVKPYLQYPEAKYLFEIANEALGYNLLKICLEGPQETLNRTEYNQPATVVKSLAALEKLRDDRPRALDTCIACAGYSVGEITALIFSGAMTFEDGMRLVGVRAAAMQDAANLVPQGMLSVHNTPAAKMSDICQKAKNWAMDVGDPTPECRVAIFLHPDMKILAGSEGALKYIEANGRSMGLRHMKRLPLSGAFHTSLMIPSLDIFKKALRTIEFEEPKVSVHSNVDGKKYKNVSQIIRYLPKQIISPVKWEQTMHILYMRPPGIPFPRTFDVGSGGTLKTLLRFVNAKACNSCYTI